MSARKVSWLPWLAMLLVVAVALVVGTVDQAHLSPADRAQKLAEGIRCPSCKSQSSASSDTPASQAVRALIADRIRAGSSDEEIRDYVASRYGRSILLDPPGSGFSALVWALPVVLVIVAVAALVIRFGAWRPGTLAATDADRDLVARATDPGDGAAGDDGDGDGDGDGGPAS